MTNPANRNEMIQARIRANRAISRTKFVSRNMKELLKAKYFTPAELIFLLEVSCYVGRYDNLVFLEKLIATERHEILELTSVLNSLVRKGAILVDIKDETALTYPLIDHYMVNPAINLYFNPEIAYNGPFFKMPSKLCFLCRQFDFIENNGVKLPWKVTVNKNNNLGYFCNRDVYLEDILAI